MVAASSARGPSPLAHAVAGAVGAVIAMALLYPLDQVRATLQVDDELARECSRPGGGGLVGVLLGIVRKNGRLALWRGMVPMLITMGVSNFVYFYCFSTLKALLLTRRSGVGGGKRFFRGWGRGRGSERGTFPSTGARGLTPLESMAASTVAGVVNVLVTTPLWVSNLRIKAGRGVGGLFSTLVDIRRKEGIEGLWAGMAPSLVLVSNPIIQFVVYETLKQSLREWGEERRRCGGAAVAADAAASTTPVVVGPTLAALGGSSSAGGAGAAARSGTGGGGGAGSLRAHEAFLLGALAKAVSTLATYPLQLAQSRLRVGLATGQHTVVQTNGVGGLYQGMRAKMLQSVLASALLFLGYEKIVEVVAKVIGGYEGCHAGGGARGKIPDGIARGGEGLCTAPPSPPPPSSR